MGPRNAAANVQQGGIGGHVNRVPDMGAIDDVLQYGFGRVPVGVFLKSMNRD